MLPIPSIRSCAFPPQYDFDQGSSGAAPNGCDSRPLLLALTTPGFFGGVAVAQAAWRLLSLLATPSFFLSTWNICTSG